MFNKDNFKMAEEWAYQTTVWTLEDILYNVAGTASYLSMITGNTVLPRKFDLVMNKLYKALISRDDVKKSVTFFRCTWHFEMSLKEVTDVVYSELMDIKEFREWNLTTLEYENGIDPDDDRPNEFWSKSNKDFIDLEAFKQNLYCGLRSKLIENYFFEGGQNEN